MIDVQSGGNKDSHGSHQGEDVLVSSKKRARETSMSECEGSDKENRLGPTMEKGKRVVKRARTDGYRSQSESDFETKVLKILQADADRRAAHEEKMEELVLKSLEEARATRQILALFVEKPHSH